MALPATIDDEFSRITPSLFVTSLLTSLAATSLPLNAVTLTSAGLPDAIRPLFSTLHLLFPHILLDALDLLDRGLITRLRVNPTEGDEHHYESTTASDLQSTTQPLVTTSHSGTGEVETTVPHSAEKVELLQSKSFYHVQSAQVTSHFRKYDRSTSQSSQHATANQRHQATQNYQVHVRAWNCSCPAFAYAAFSNPVAVEAPKYLRDHVLPQDSRNNHHNSGQDSDRNTNSEAVQQPPRLLSTNFGGLMAVPRSPHIPPTQSAPSVTSSTLQPTTMPPVCKHLLACTLADICPNLFPVIAENSGARLGGVVEHSISQEEAAGWAAGWAAG